MKKLIATVLALSMVLAFAGCGETEAPETTAAPETTEAPETTAPVETTEAAAVMTH